MVKLRAKDHQGMRVDYKGMLRQAREALRGGLHAEMLRQLQEHLREMGERFYEGDVAAVDEFLQLYCIARDQRATPVPVDTEDAIQKLAAELPEGFSVAVDIERDSGSVTLYHPGSVTLETIHPDEGTMGERLLAALEVAKGAAS